MKKLAIEYYKSAVESIDKSVDDYAEYFNTSSSEIKAAKYKLKNAKDLLDQYTSAVKGSYIKIEDMYDYLYSYSSIIGGYENLRKELLAKLKDFYSIACSMVGINMLLKAKLDSGRCGDIAAYEVHWQASQTYERAEELIHQFRAIVCPFKKMIRLNEDIIETSYLELEIIGLTTMAMNLDISESSQ